MISGLVLLPCMLKADGISMEFACERTSLSRSASLENDALPDRRGKTYNRRLQVGMRCEANQEVLT